MFAPRPAAFRRWLGVATVAVLLTVGVSWQAAWAEGEEAPEPTPTEIEPPVDPPVDPPIEPPIDPPVEPPVEGPTTSPEPTSGGTHPAENRPRTVTSQRSGSGRTPVRPATTTPSPTAESAPTPSPTPSPSATPKPTPSAEPAEFTWDVDYSDTDSPATQSALASIALVASGVMAGLLGVGVFVYKRFFANSLPTGNFRRRR